MARVWHKLCMHAIEVATKSGDLLPNVCQGQQARPVLEEELRHTKKILTQATIQ